MGQEIGEEPKARYSRKDLFDYLIERNYGYLIPLFVANTEKFNSKVPKEIRKEQDTTASLDNSAYTKKIRSSLESVFSSAFIFSGSNEDLNFWIDLRNEIFYNQSKDCGSKSEL